MTRLHSALLTALLAAQPFSAALADEAAPQPNPPRSEAYQAGVRAVDAGRLEEAIELLRTAVAEDPNNAGAVLELALAHCELGHTEDALRLFDEINRTYNPPPGIVDVINTYRAAGCRPRDTRPASWAMGISRGYDNNVNQGVRQPTVRLGTGENEGEYELDPEFRPKADSYTALNGSYVQPLNARGTLGIVQANVRRHDHQHSQDSATMLAGIEHSWYLGRWRARAAAVLGAGTLDGKLYQRQQQLQLRAAPPITLAPNWDIALAANASHVSYTTRQDYDSSTFELGTIATYRSKRDQVQLTLHSARDNGSATRPGGDRRGWFANAQWYTMLKSGWYAEAGLTHQHWQGERAYSPGLIEQSRRQDTTTGRAAVQWYFRPNVSLQLEARAVRNHENIPLFQYNSRAVQLNLRWDNF